MFTTMIISVFTSPVTDCLNSLCVTREQPLEGGRAPSHPPETQKQVII